MAKDYGFIHVRHYPAGRYNRGTLYPWGDMSQSPFVQQVRHEIEEEAAEMREVISRGMGFDLFQKDGCA